MLPPAPPTFSITTDCARAPRMGSARIRASASNRRPLGWPPAMRRRGVEIGHLVVAVEREDARLRATGEIRERASFDLDGDHARRLVDGVGPIIGDAALHHRIVLVR